MDHSGKKYIWWIQLIVEEQNLAFNEISKGKKVIGNKWVLKIKWKANSDIDRYKAHLVAKGFTKEGETILVNHLDDGVHGQRLQCGWTAHTSCDAK
jgi:hypothetical protein